MKNLAIIVAAVVIAGCATKPRNIPPASVSPVAWKQLSCRN